MKLEESSKLVRLLVPHEVLNAEDSGEIANQHRHDHWESRERCFTLHIAGEVLGEVDIG